MASEATSRAGGAREHLAWLMWCFSEGYVKAEDRAIMTNWLLKDPATLHPDDAALRPHLLAMADEVLTEVLMATDPAEFILTRWLHERAVLSADESDSLGPN